MRRPLIYILIALIAGIICGYYFTLPGSLYIFFALIAAAIIFFSFSLHKSASTLALSLLFLLIFFIGFLNIQKHQYLIKKSDHIYHYIDAGKQTWEGIVADNPAWDKKRTTLIVRVSRLKQNDTYRAVSGSLRLVVPWDANLRYGDYIRFTAALKQIHGFYNPEAFDYRRRMNMKGIFAAAFVSDETQLLLLRKNAGSQLRLELEKYRYHLQDLLNAHSSSPAREIIAAMTLGNKGEIPAEVRDNFNRTGTSHLLAISGLHIGMVFIVGFFVFYFLLKRSEFMLLRFNVLKIASVAAFIFVMIYALIAGMGITVIRAALMALVVLLAFLLGRQKDVYNIIALAGIIILLFLPDALFDISFQLSFSAVFSLVYLVPRFSRFSFSFMDKWPGWAQISARKVYSQVIVCVAASIGTMPLIAYYFHQVSTITVLANLFAVVLLGMISLSLSMGFIISASFSTVLAAIFIKASSFFTNLSLQIIEKLASLYWSSFSLTRPSLLEIAVFYLFIFLLVQLGDRRFVDPKKKSYFIRKPALHRMLLAFCIVFFVGNAVYLSVRDRFSNTLRITVIDVGQGSSVLVRFPQGKNMLIDGGGFAQGSFDTGKMVIAPFLLAQRIDKIHTLVLTHPHPDHLQGLIYIADNFHPDAVWSTGQRTEDEMYLQWEKIITEKTIKTKIFHAQCPPVNINGVWLDVLWPPAPPVYTANDYNHQKVNDDSMVIKMTYGKHRILLAADISSQAEQLLIQANKDLKSDVLFVPHHGSRYSSSAAFIKAASARHAVISAGKNNLFRHPHPAALQRYADAQVKIYRTDESGAISIATDGTNLSIDTYRKSR